MTSVQLVHVGRSAFALGLLCLGLIGVATGQLIPALQPAMGPSGLAGFATYNGMIVLLLSAGIFTTRLREHSATMLACYFSAWLIAAHGARGLAGDGDVTAVVAVFQLSAIVALLLTLGLPGRTGPTGWLATAQIITGSMLAIFGWVHYNYHGFISTMIPDWIPAANLWPWITGSVNLAGGIAIMTGYRAQLGGALVGAMFVSWIPIVHLPRILAQPGSAQEWSAAALALTLAGAVWLAAGRARSRCPVAATADRADGQRMLPGGERVAPAPNAFASGQENGDCHESSNGP